MRQMMTAAAVAVATFGSGGAASAQEVVRWSVPPAADHGRYAYFPMGTPLALSTRVELSTRNNRAGDRFALEVSEPLTYRGQVVVPAGAPAVGEVMRIERSGAVGKRGEMAVRLLYVQTPSGPIRLSGKAERAGFSQAALAIGGAAVIFWPMIFIHGTSARLPAGTAVTAYLADDLRFPVAAAPYDSAASIGGGAQVALAQPLPARFDPSAFSGVRP